MFTVGEKEIYRPIGSHILEGKFTDPPATLPSPMEYFKMFFTENIMNIIVENTNLYSVQKCAKSIGTTTSEMATYIGMHVLMGVVNLPSYTNYWSTNLRYPPIADVMPRKRFELIRRYLHVVDNNDYDELTDDKLFKIRPLIEAVRDECVKVEPEEYQSVDEQIIPSKTKFSKVRQYNPKKPKKWGFKNLVRAGNSGIMYDFYLYAGKEDCQNQSPYNHLQKCAQVVARLCKDLPANSGHI